VFLILLALLLEYVLRCSGRAIAVEKYFLHSISELNIDQVEGKAAIRSYACEIAQQIVEGKFTSLRDAIQPLYQIWIDTDYDREFEVWQELDDALDSLQADEFPYTYPSATLKNFEELLMQVAVKFIYRLTSQS
jgi:hypothetical protein